MATLRINVDDHQVQQALASLATKTANLKPAFAQVGEYMVLRTQERFKQERDPQGNPWTKLAVSTLKRKQKKAKIPKILQQDGDLRKSIVYKASNSQVEIGSNRKYARIHQLGGRAGRGHKVIIPARPYLGVDAVDSAEIQAIVEDFLR